MAEGGYWRDETDHDRAPRHSGLYSQHYLVQLEQASLETCTLLNSLGYGSHIRQTRRDAYREYDRITTALGVKRIVKMITTGSKADGLTSCLESDRDIMFVRDDIMCVENDVNFDSLPIETNVFSLNTDMCYHGHCRLFLEERPGTMIPPIFRDSLCADEHGRALLSSDLFANNVATCERSPKEVRHERAGPSMPRSLCGVLHTDCVFSIHCYCPSILRKWAERPRHWPSADVVRKVVSMGSFVTPVGFKGSEYKHVEWRICFNTGENELMGSLNNTQVYIYVILKMVVKDVLKPVKKEITSYTVKNIVLWLAENSPPALFHEKTLFYWLREGLRELRSAILTEHISYYMIPERNLMAACGMDKKQQRTWIQIITDMIDEGPKVLFRLPKIRQAIISHPEPLLWYSKKRLELELLHLMFEIRMDPCRNDGAVYWSDNVLKAIIRRKKEIIREVNERMYWEGGRVYDAIEIQNNMLM